MKSVMQVALSTLGKTLYVAMTFSVLLANR